MDIHRRDRGETTRPKGTKQTVVSCPALAVCAEFGTARSTCRYDPDSLPPVGMNTYSPEDAWCPPGVITLVLLMAGRRP
jgi:hypothetical protein